MAGEWNSYRLDEVCEFINGFAFKSTDYVPPSSETIEVFRMGYIERGGGFKEDNSPVFVPKKYGRNLERFVLKAGDVTIAMTDMKDRVAILGNTAWIREESRFVLNQRVGCIRVKRPDLLDPRFLYFYSNWRPHVDYLRSRANSGVQVNLSTSAITDSVLEIPPLDEQRAIAHILGTLDDKIELNRRMNETLESMARALFKSWFVDFDPVRAKAERRDPGLPKPLADLFPGSFEDSELGEIPKGWRASVLGEEVTRCGGRIQTGPFGSQLHASDYVDDGVPVVMPKDLSRRRVSTLSIARVKLSDAERLSRHRLQEGDIVYSRRGDVERHGLVRSRETGWLCGTGCLLVRLGSEWPSPLFASIALDRPETRAWIVQHAIGATMPNLNTGILARVPIVVPPDNLLRVFNRVAQPLADHVIASDAQTETLASLRDSLLPKLVSGELRVAHPKTLAEAAQ